MPTSPRKLLAYTQRRDLRPALAGPDASDWTPYAESSPTDYFLCATDWEDVRIVVLEDGSPVLNAATTVQFQLLYRIPDKDPATNPTVSAGSIWLASELCTLDADCPHDLFVVDGHDFTVRVMASTIGGGGNLTFVVTGGQRQRIA